MDGFHPLLLLELFVFAGAALVWGFWELWQTDRAIRRARDQAAPDPEAVPDSGSSGHAEGEHELYDGRP